MSTPEFEYQLKEYMIAKLESHLLRRENEILRSWGNKDCTNMADDAINIDQAYQDVKETLEYYKDSRRLVIPESEGIV